MPVDLQRLIDLRLEKDRREQIERRTKGTITLPNPTAVTKPPPPPPKPINQLDLDEVRHRMDALVNGRDEVRVPADVVLFSIGEVAYWFGVSRNMIQREVAKGRIQVHKLGEGTKTSPVRISLAEVRRYLRDRLKRGVPAKRR